MRDKAQEILSRRVTEWHISNPYSYSNPHDGLPNSVLIDAMEEYAAILVDKERAKHEFSK
jgi:hypothetical protein